MSLFTDMLAAGVEVDSHESDLYVKASPAASAILRRYPVQQSNALYFWNQVAGGMWIDVPFAYDPWWERRGCTA